MESKYLRFGPIKYRPFGGNVPRLIQPRQLAAFVERMKGNHPAIIVVTEAHTLGYIASKRDFELCHNILKGGEDEHTLRVDIVLELAGKPPIPSL